MLKLINLYHQSNKISTFSIYNHSLKWFIIINLFNLQFLSLINANIVCPKLFNGVRKTPRFGKRSIDYNKIYPIECLEFKRRLINELVPIAKLIHSSEIFKSNYELIDSSLILSSLTSNERNTNNNNNNNNLLNNNKFNKTDQFEKYLSSILNKRIADKSTTKSSSLENNKTTITITKLTTTSLNEVEKKDTTNSEAILKKQREILAKLFLSYIDKLKEQKQQQQKKNKQ